METQAQREQRIQRLERDRAERNAIGVWPTPDDIGSGVVPVEIGPGRGNLDYTSGFMPTIPTALWMVGKTVSFARLFQSQPWVAAAVMRMLTWAVRVPLKVYRKTGDDENSRVRLYPQDHPLAAAICSPWERGYTAQFVQWLLGPVLVHGNSVTQIEQGASNAIQFVSQDWRFTRPIMPFRDSIAGYTFNIDSPTFQVDVSVDKVLHIAWWSPIGPIGTSPLQQLGITLDIEDAAQRYQRSLFKNGARPPSAILTSEAFLGIDRAERQQIMANLRADITHLYSGPDQAGTPAILPPGLTWDAVGLTSVEAELIDQRKVTREEIAGVYLISPPMLGIMDRATYSNIETLREMTYTDCVGPPLVMLEQAINAQIVRDLLREDDVYCEFDFGGVLRGDRLQEITAIREGISSALYTPNEGRSYLNMPSSPEEGMDDFYLPFNNLQPVGSPPVPSQPARVFIPPGSPTPDAPPPGPPQGPPSESRRLAVRSRDGDYDIAYMR
jgi:HK97 family phage portal protein